MKRITIIVILIGILCLVVYDRIHYDRPEFEETIYIAHAGGAIDGYTQTNVLEAIENAIRKGYDYIELDLILTADSALVACHDWETYNEYTGRPAGTPPPTLAEFLATPILGKYTPVTAEMIDTIMAENPSLTLVTDKTDDAKLLKQFFWVPTRNRMIVETFSDTACLSIDASPCREGMINTRGPEKDLIHALIFMNEEYYKERTVTVPLSLTSQRKFRLVNALLNRPLAVYTARDRHQADSIREALHPRFIYVDEL
ncbi:MAG: hypothetical protein NC336_04695 [Clostridium sp.]|nr:hypothetical protein [Clostridium sp.]